MYASNIHQTIATAAVIAVALTMPASAGEWTFYSTDDSTISQYSPNGWHGDWQHMCVRNRYGGGGGIWEIDSLVRFDISSIPTGTNITSATLNLYYFKWWDNNPAGRSLTCYRITSDWDDSDVTWNNRPTWLPPGQWTDAAAVPGSTGQWMAWDVTSDVQEFVDGTAANFGWSIMDEKYWGGAGIPLIGFRTREYGTFVPYLQVVPSPGVPSLLAIAGLVLSSRRR